jgi:hypothetical protein
MTRKGKYCIAAGSRNQVRNQPTVCWRVLSRFHRAGAAHPE